MFFRGGLLIEPWKPFHYYTNDPKIQSVVLFEDVVYTCNLAHQSGETFAENAGKFTSAGSGGGTGGSLIPAGNWDIASSTTSSGPVESTIAFATGYDATFNGLTVVSAGAEIYRFDEPYTLFSAATEQTVINDFSTTKWFTVDVDVDVDEYHLMTLHDVANITNPVTDILQPIFKSTLGTKKVICFMVGAFFGNTICQILYNGPTYSEVIALANGVVNMVGVTQIAIGINSTLGKGYVDNFVDAVYEFDLPGDLFEDVANLQFSAGGVYGSAFGVGATVISFPTPVTKHPITQMRAEVVVVPPVGANDGTLWKATSNGTFGNSIVKANDYVIFFDAVSQVVVIADVAAELSSLQVQVDSHTTQITDGTVSVVEKAKIRRIIDYIRIDAPPSPVKGQTVICLNNCTIQVNSSDATPYSMVVYNGTAWEYVTSIEDMIWHHPASNLSFYRNAVQSETAYEYDDTFASITELLDVTKHTHWHLFTEFSTSLVLTDAFDTVDTINVSFEHAKVVTLRTGVAGLYTEGSVEMVSLPTGNTTGITSPRKVSLIVVNDTAAEFTIAINNYTTSSPTFYNKFVVPRFESLELEFSIIYGNVLYAPRNGKYKTLYTFDASTMDPAYTLHNVRDVFFNIDVNAAGPFTFNIPILPSFDENIKVEFHYKADFAVVYDIEFYDGSTTYSETINIAPGDKRHTFFFNPLDTVQKLRVY